MNTNKKALVLSSTRGIGYAICKQFAEMGHDVILHGRSESSVKSAIEKINSHNGQQKVSGLNADLYNKREVSHLAEKIQESSPDILILNSGGPKAGGWRDLNQSEFDQEVSMITESANLFLRSALPSMCDKGWGRVINISSVGLIKPIPVLAASNASRSYLHGLMVGMATEYASSGITFNTICPGIILTDRQIDLAKHDAANSENETFEQILEKKASLVPAGKMGKPEDVAALVSFLSTNSAGYITSQKIAVDGGLLGVF